MVVGRLGRKAVDADRAQSLEFRFDQEAILLAHASERFYFGWGRYGRNRVITEAWGQGKDNSVTDGLWIITLGQFGFIGFLAQFLLLVFPIFKAYRCLKYAETYRAKILLAATSLIVAIIAIDQLPNASLSPWSWLLAGSLLGQSEALFARSSKTRPLNNLPTEATRPLMYQPSR